MKIPKLKLTNYRHHFPSVRLGCFDQWFCIQRMWMGKLIFINVRYWTLTIDFRGDWMKDM